MTGFTFRHDGRTRLNGGKLDLGKPSAGAACKQAQIIGHADEIQTEISKGARKVGEGGKALHGLEEIGGRSNHLVAEPAQALSHFFSVVGMGVDSGADGGSSQADPTKVLSRLFDSFEMIFKALGIAGKFLPQPDRRGVLQMSSPGFDDAEELFFFFSKGTDEFLKGRDKFPQFF